MAGVVLLHERGLALELGEDGPHVDELPARGLDHVPRAHRVDLARSVRARVRAFRVAFRPRQRVLRLREIALHQVGVMQPEHGMKGLSLDAAKLSGTVAELPRRDQMPLDLNEQLVVEYYSR